MVCSNRFWLAGSPAVALALPMLAVPVALMLTVSFSDALLLAPICRSIDLAPTVLADAVAANENVSLTAVPAVLANANVTPLFNVAGVVPETVMSDPLYVLPPSVLY